VAFSAVYTRRTPEQSIFYKAFAATLYDALETRVFPVYYDDKQAWRDMQRAAVAAAPDFSAQRMVLAYATRYYGWQPPRTTGRLHVMT